ncbi:MAG: (d)CMP kinase [Candidatus Hodarchaeota archaeon]
MILTISGLHGTGKSVVGKKIALALGIKYYSTGEAFRDLAKEKNMTLEDFTKYVEKHIEIDKELDKKIIEIAKKDEIIIDSQLSGYLLKDIADFKILLKCSLEIRVKRMAERDNTTYEEKLKETELREKSESERFILLYNIKINDMEKAKEIFDIILDTEKLSVEEAVNKILEEIKKIII